MTGSSTAVTEDVVRSSPMTMVPSVMATEPRTLAIPAWRVVKPASLCEGSMTQVPVRDSVGRAVVVVLALPCPEIVLPTLCSVGARL